MTVAGGGPVGMGIAIELGRRGIDVTVVERESELHSIPKGQNLTQRTMEHFRSWGVEDAVRKARIMPPGYPAAGVNAYGNLLSPYSHPWFRRSQVADYYFAANERLPQYLTERALRERAAEMAGVAVVYGEAVTKVEPREDTVLTHTDSRTIESDWLIGADGSHSTVRHNLGIEEESRDHDRRMVLIVFRSRELFELLSERFGQAAFFNVLHPDLDGYWRFLGTVDVAEGWFFHAPVDAHTTADGLDYKALLNETVGAEFDVDLDHIGFWDLRVAIANDYRSGRAFLAGDSAHSHPPYGGYGINTGFEDARNLGWKLAAVIEGWAGEALLDTYNFERRSVFASTAKHFIEGFIERDREFLAATEGKSGDEFARAWEERRTTARFGVADFAPHYEGSPAVLDDSSGSPGAVGAHDLVARAGHHLPPLHDDPAMFDRLGDWYSLILGRAHYQDAVRIETMAQDLAMPIELVLVDDPGQYEAGMVLVRPDHYVAWAGDGVGSEFSGSLRRLTGR